MSTFSFFSAALPLTHSLIFLILIPYIVSPPTHTQYSAWKAAENHPGVRGLSVTTGGCAGKEVGDVCGETKEECGTPLGTYKYVCAESANPDKPGNDLTCFRPKVYCDTTCTCSGAVTCITQWRARDDGTHTPP